MPGPMGFGMSMFDPGQFMQNNDLPEPYGQPEPPQDYNSLAAAMGVTMPAIPQRDSMGMYGITDAQRGNADNRAFGNVLMGAAQSMFNTDPNAVLQAGMQAGGIREGMLQQYSKQNMGDYDLRVKEALAKLNSLDKMSDIQLQRTNIALNQEKLDQMELEKEVAKKWGEAMMPMASAELAKVRSTDPELATQIEGQLIGVQKFLAAGNLAAAETQMNAAMEMSPEYFQRSMARGMVRETARASAKYGMIAEMVPKIQEMVQGMPGFENYQLSLGKDGQIDFMSPEEIQNQSLANQVLQQQISTNAALQRKYDAQATASGKLDYKNILKQTRDVEKAIKALEIPAPIDMNKKVQWEKDRANAMAALEAIGVDPNNKNAIAELSKAGTQGIMSKVRDIGMQAYYLANDMPIPGAMGGGQPSAAPRGDMILPQILGGLKKAIQQNPTPDEAKQLLNVFQRARSPEAQAIFMQSVAENGPLYMSDPVAFLRVLEQKMEAVSGYSGMNPSQGEPLPQGADGTLFLPQ